MDNLCGLNELLVCWPGHWDIGVLRVKCVWEIVIKFANVCLMYRSAAVPPVLKYLHVARRGINVIYLSIHFVELVSY